MRILIDTNILIPLEDINGLLEKAYAELFKILNENNHQVIVHPGSIDDLHRDRDSERKAKLLSKASKYTLLDSPPEPSRDELTELGLSESRDNDRVDNLIIYAMNKSAAHILITEDRGIHKKARKLGLDENVHYIQQALNFFKELHDQKLIQLPNVQHVNLYNIDIGDSFFDSLRESYCGFNDWYRQKAADGRKAWAVINTDDRPEAIVIHKDEENEMVTIDHKILRGKSLKLCTFKVGENIRGKKIGELMVKMAFEHAIVNRYQHVYLTIRPGLHDHLKDLCQDFGFYEFGTHVDGEDEVYVKEIPCEAPRDTELPPFEYYKKYHPHFICSRTGKYIIPIRPHYHDLLFPEKVKALFAFSVSAGNTIKKAYLSHAQLKQMHPGDAVLFYRSNDRKEITTLGIVERFEVHSDPDEIAKLVSKRTVYSQDDIRNLCKKEVKVMLFRLVTHFERPIKRQQLQELGVAGNIQSVRLIEDDVFDKIMNAGGRDLCLKTS